MLSSEKPITIPTDHKALSPELLLRLQTLVLELLQSRKIAIETMPSSNVRISLYDHLSEHHISRWLGLDGEGRGGALPTLVVGSDDPGIFSTNLRNEYAGIYEIIMASGISSDEAITHLERLRKNSRAYRFC